MNYGISRCLVCRQVFPTAYLNESWLCKNCSEEIETVRESDVINKPDHYHKGGIDVIGFAESKFSPEQLEGFYRINAIKYLTRYDEKGQALQDLKKAQFYMNKLIELYERHEVKATP